MQLICRNRVADYDQWWRVFESHADAHKEAGLSLRGVWRNADDANEVFFLFDVDDRTKAQAFIDTPQAAEGAMEAGVIDGDYYFIVEAETNTAQVRFRSRGIL